MPPFSRNVGGSRIFFDDFTHRQRQQVFAEKRNLLDVDREFASAGAEQVAADADVVADVEQFVQVESPVANRVFLHIDLQLLPALLQVSEPGLAHQANRHDPSGHTHIDARSFELLGRLRRVVGQNLRDCVRELVLAGVGGLAQRCDPLQFLAPQVVDFVVE